MKKLIFKVSKYILSCLVFLYVALSPSCALSSEIQEKAGKAVYAHQEGLQFGNPRSNFFVRD